MSVVSPDSTATFTPVVKLEEVEVDNGEKDENEVYRQRSALYRFDADIPAWKERGKGDVRILQHKENKKCRIVLRESKTLKLRMNHFLNPVIELTPNSGSDRSWTWATTDYAWGDARMETFAIRFKNSEIANKFKEVYDTYKQCNAESDEKSPVAPAADADADAAPAADADKKDDSTDAAPAADATDADDSDDKAAGFALWKDIFDSKNDVEVLSDEDLKEIFDTFDADKTDSIDRKELAVLIETAITSAFKKNGLDAELESITESMGEVVAALSESALKTLDDNKDGSLSWEEVKGMDIMKLIFATGE